MSHGGKRKGSGRKSAIGDVATGEQRATITRSLRRGWISTSEKEHYRYLSGRAPAAQASLLFSRTSRQNTDMHLRLDWPRGERAAARAASLNLRRDSSRV
jgi:hypothetical protein